MSTPTEIPGTEIPFEITAKNRLITSFNIANIAAVKTHPLSYVSNTTICPANDDSRVVASRISKQEGPGSIPGGGKEV